MRKRKHLSPFRVFTTVLAYIMGAIVLIGLFAIIRHAILHHF